MRFHYALRWSEQRGRVLYSDANNRDNHVINNGTMLMFHQYVSRYVYFSLDDLIEGGSDGNGISTRTTPLRPW